jgi:PKD repeat protein
MKRLCIGIFLVVLLSFSYGCDKAGTNAEIVSDSIDSSVDLSRSLIIVNSLAETLSILDDNSHIHNNIQLTGAAPNSILYEKPYVYIVNSLSNSILVLKDSDLSVAAEVSVGKNKNPMYAASIGNNQLAVSCFISHSLEILDISQKKVRASIDLSGIPLPSDVAGITGRSYPEGVAVSGGRIFVALSNLTDYYGGLTAAGSGVVAVFDAKTLESLGTVELEGADPVDVKNLGGKILIACAGHYMGDITKPQSSGFEGDGTIEMIDVQTLKLEKSYRLSAAPFSFSVSESGILYATNAIGGNIPRIDLSKGAVDYLAVESSYISSVLCAKDVLYVLDFSKDALFVLDTSGSMKARYTAGDGPIAMLSIAGVSAEYVIIPEIAVYPEIASPGIDISFNASGSIVPEGIYTYTWDFGDGQTAAGPSVSHAYETAGAYSVTLTIEGDAGTAIETCVVTIVASSPFATMMCAYNPAPGQFVNDPQYNDPAKALGQPKGGRTPLQPDNSSIVSLGGFGGSITLAFDHRVLDNPGGYDFIVFGNAQYSGAPLRFVEPGVVEISEDGFTWFLIPGSHLRAPFERITKTYSNGQVFSAYQLPADTQDGIVNGKYTLWGYADLSPVLALPDMADPARYFTIPDDPILTGIDTGTCGGDAFDIAWAVDPRTGTAANLSGFRYIRITTGVDRNLGGSLGELSTEIDAVADIGLE